MAFCKATNLHDSAIVVFVVVFFFFIQRTSSSFLYILFISLLGLPVYQSCPWLLSPSFHGTNWGQNILDRPLLYHILCLQEEEGYTVLKVQTKILKDATQYANIILMLLLKLQALTNITVIQHYKG